jgi:nicotinamidase-related amidase
MATDRLDPQHTCLLFFDTSKSVVNGPTLKREARLPERDSIVENWQRQLALARELGMMVAYAQTAQRPDGANYFPRMMDLDDEDKPFPIGARRPMSPNVLGVQRVETVDEIAPGPDDYIFYKERWDPWQGTNFELSLRRRGIDTIIANGGATDIGIAATAYGAHRLDFDIVIVSDGCLSRHADGHDVFMREVYPRIGRVRTTNQVLAMLRAG